MAVKRRPAAGDVDVAYKDHGHSACVLERWNLRETQAYAQMLKLSHTRPSAHVWHADAPKFERPVAVQLSLPHLAPTIRNQAH
jgi:hypothetical protein